MHIIPTSRTARLALASVLTMGQIFATVQAQDLQEISRDGQKAILAAPGLQIAGARHPDLTIVEYFDYNCPFCKQVVPTFKQLLAEDGKLAIVYKDWPVLGESSVYAARCALAASWQDKYLIAHDAMLSGPRLRSNDQIESILQRAGVDLDRLRRDLVTHSAEITALLARSDAEAHALDLDGTPGILVGRELMPGGADVIFFRKLIAAVRKQPK